jgi:mRNA interferase RelE/StbE
LPAVRWVHDVVASGAARRQLQAIPAKAAVAIYELMAGDLGEVPHRVGKPLRWDFDGLWVARRGEYRIVYEVDDDTRTVTVIRIDHRRDVYRAR